MRKRDCLWSMKMWQLSISASKQLDVWHYRSNVSLYFYFRFGNQSSSIIFIQNLTSNEYTLKELNTPSARIYHYQSRIPFHVSSCMFLTSTNRGICIAWLSWRIEFYLFWSKFLGWNSPDRRGTVLVTRKVCTTVKNAALNPSAITEVIHECYY